MAKKKPVLNETIYDETQLLHPAENTGVAEVKTYKRLLKKDAN